MGRGRELERNHQANLFQFVVNAKGARELNMPQLKKQELFSWERCSRWHAEMWCTQEKTMPSNLRTPAFHSSRRGNDCLILWYFVLWFDPSAMCVCWAKIGWGEHWERGAREKREPCLLSPLGWCCFWRRSPSRLQALGQSFTLFLDSVWLMWKCWVFWAGDCLPSGVVLLLWRWNKYRSTEVRNLQ